MDKLWPAGKRPAHLEMNHLDMTLESSLVTQPETAGAPDAHLAHLAEGGKAWPFVESRGLAKRLVGKAADTAPVLFETGYGPSGLPHIGTFGEVVRTTMVRHAFTVLSGMPTRLLAFSDDMDALRKVPDNVPNREMLAGFLGRPLTSIPDPFGEFESFGHHNNARLRGFLDRFGFDYEFGSATAYYKAGRFDETLRKVLAAYDEVTNIVLPTLGPERRATYSPFLPVCATTGRVLQARVVARDVDAGTIVYEDEGGAKVETPVTGGHCKLQWKADWAMRWAALGVDYEMSGKDLIESVNLASRICRVLGCRPPMNLIYELFLDDNGEKISKSKGNGLSVEEWLRYAPQESLAYFMYTKPKTAKRLHIAMVPRTVDDYIGQLNAFAGQDEAQQLDNPVWHVHSGRPPAQAIPVSFGLLLNLVSACHSEDRSVIWHYVAEYYGDEAARSEQAIAPLIDHAIEFYRDFVKPNQTYRLPEAAERPAFGELARQLKALPAEADAEEVQKAVYEVGKAHADTYPGLKDWFRALYQVLLGQDEGPRMGTFILLYGVEKTVAMIEEVLASGRGRDGSS